MSVLDQFTQTTDSVDSRLTVTDSVYTDVINRLTNAQTRAAGGRSSILTQTQRDALAGEIRGAASAILTAVNTSYRGMYLFSGGQSLTPPYSPGPPISSYQGDGNVQSIDVARDRSVQVTFDGSAILQGAAPADVFQTLEALATAVQTGNMAGIDQGLADVGAAFDRVTNAQTQIGIDTGPAARGSGPAGDAEASRRRPALIGRGRQPGRGNLRHDPGRHRASRRPRLARQPRSPVADGLPQMTAAQGEGAAPDVLRLYTHFGAFNLKTDDVIAFPSGLPGFEADRRFVLLSAPTYEPVQCLQSIDAASPSFLVVDPRRVLPDYRARLNQSDLDAPRGRRRDVAALAGYRHGRRRRPVRQPQGAGRHQPGADAGIPAGTLGQRLPAAAAAVRRNRCPGAGLHAQAQRRHHHRGRDRDPRPPRRPRQHPPRREGAAERAGAPARESTNRFVEANRAAAARRDLPAAVAARLGKKSEPAT